MLTGGRHPAIRAVLAGAAIALTTALLFSTTAASPAFAATDHDAGGIGSWPWPLIGEVVGEYRNGSDPYAAGQHRGVDIAAPAGTPARAVVAGTVSFSGKLPDGGQTVTIRSAEHLVSYLHLSRRDLSRGASVGVGEVVGLVGTTGKRSTTRPHLHLGVRLAATRRYVDPMTLLGPKRVAEKVRSAPSPARAESNSKPATQRAGGERRVRIEPLEQAVSDEDRPAVRNVQPKATADSSASIKVPTRHSDQRSPRPAISVEAPPPLKAFAEDPEQQKESQAPPVLPTKPAVTTATTNDNPAIPLRLLLLALVAIALVVLFANRRSSTSDHSLPTGPSENGEAKASEVAEDDRPPLRAVK